MHQSAHTVIDEIVWKKTDLALLRPPTTPARIDDMTGRPTIRNEDQINDILDRLTAGEPLAAILRDDGMPKPSTWYDWCGADEALSGRVARAREHGAASIAADCLRIADTQQIGEIVRDSEKDGRVVTQEDMLGHRKLQIETRLKLLRCWDPKNYGDKLEVDSKGTMAVAVTIQRLSDAPVQDVQDGEAEPA